MTDEMDLSQPSVISKALFNKGF